MRDRRAIFCKVSCVYELLGCPQIIEQMAFLIELPAVLHFPANFTFSAVGKTNGDERLRDVYAEQVKRAVLAISGDVDSTFEVLPRGKKFTKVQCVVEVQSATMISSIFEDIANLERTVMRF
jgi:putative lipoic acid-binding regulatory protein